MRPFSILFALLTAGWPALAQEPAGDPVYRQLREAQLSEAFPVQNLVIERDAGTFHLESGTVSFLPPLEGRVTGGVFIGQGSFTLTPAVFSEAQHMARVFGITEVAEPFERAVFYFTDDTYSEIKGSAAAEPVPEDAAAALNDIHDLLRQRRDEPRSTLEARLTGEDMDNVEADILSGLYNPDQPGFFSAYMRGANYRDLRFHVKPGGALPSMSAEEVALVYFNPGNEDEGIWYLAHNAGEYAQPSTDSVEDKWIVDAEAYRITTEIGGNEHLTSSATVQVRALKTGDRMIKFGLLPSLRVSEVKLGGAEVPYIQEDRRADASFYVILPEPLQAGESYELTIDYAGDRVIHDAGGGNYSVEARTSWYPALNSFRDQALYDLTFRVPRRETLVSVGRPVSEERDGDFMVSHWVSEVPLAVAGFNYGRFNKKQDRIDQINYDIESYATSRMPDSLEALRDITGPISPNRASEQAMVEADVAMRIYTQFFGAAPYGRIAVTQQPEFSFGQSWPGLVYLPLVAFIDATTRYTLFDRIDVGVNAFVQEVTPHEVAHQWWGHMVGWSSYRDQWLSEGFADFSAGLFLQLTGDKPDRYLKFLQDSRDAILDRNSYGLSANDAGPIDMGTRLNTPRTGRAYQNLVYSKGAYVLHMLRMMMWDPKTGDQQFIAMMHDFVQSHLYKNASTASFQSVAEKYMNANMNMTNDGSLDWFFDQWVHGTEVPKYDFTYEIVPEGDKFRLKASLAQTGVGPEFRMPVPIYVEVNDRIVRLGTMSMLGESTSPPIEVLMAEKPDKVSINAYFDILAQK